MEPSVCLNCEQSLQPHFVYCPQCSQKVHLPALTARSLGMEFLHSLTSVERGLFTLLLQLAIRPGMLVREYLAGKRKKYFPAVSFFLLTAGVLVVSVALFHPLDSAFTAPEQPSAPVRHPLYRLLTANLNWTMIVLAPFTALFYRIWYWKRTQTFMEHLLISLYWNGFLLLVFAVLFSPAAYLFPGAIALERLLFLFLGVQCLYFGYGYGQLYSHRGVVSFVRHGVGSVVVSLFVILWFVLLLRGLYFLNQVLP